MTPEDIQRFFDMREVPYWCQVATDVFFQTLNACAQVRAQSSGDEIDVLEALNVEGFTCLESQDDGVWTWVIFWPHTGLHIQLTDRDEVTIAEMHRSDQKVFCSQPVVNNWENPDAPDVMSFLATVATRYALLDEVPRPECCWACGSEFEDECQSDCESRKEAK